MSRKVIQVTSTRFSGSKACPDIVLFALCDDGTIWGLHQKGWKHVVAIPQGELMPEDAADIVGGLAK